MVQKPHGKQRKSAAELLTLELRAGHPEHTSASRAERAPAGPGNLEKLAI